MSTKQANRLIYEKSPYLLQHAYNPVDWHPWGDETFDRARREDKPVFLSIGYSTCHWCHVMERESFEDREVADVLNRVFVCIKVDREERPDLDHLYMSVCQTLTGSGGWPLTVLLTPDRRPFFAGTYFPPKTARGRLGLIELAGRVEELWKRKRSALLDTADKILSDLQKISAAAPGDMPGEELLHQAYEELSGRFDAKHGGFGIAPKFPTPHNLTFLLRYYRRTGSREALQMAEKTLSAMADGGIYDHIGFGFHRYSTDRFWLLPHFEKMLYDQAMLAIAYLEAYQATGNGKYAKVAEQIFHYVERQMTSPEGGFYSAEDADSEGEEGKFYVWSLWEIEEILGKEDAALFSAVYNIRRRGNFHDEATGAPTGLNIPHITKPLAELARGLGLPAAELQARLAAMREKLFAVRKKRVHPHLDDKILTDWNGLMIAALALAGRVLQNSRYTQTASRAAGFILARLKKDGRLLKRYRDGEAALPAHLDDYAFFIWGLIELYESSFEAGCLAEALSLNQTMIKHFWDRKSGGFFFTADDAEDLIIRHREAYDGAIPSGNSVAALNNLRLARLTGNLRLEEIAAKTIRAFSSGLRQTPHAYTQLLAALDFLLGPAFEIVIAGDPNAEDTQGMLAKLYQVFLPGKAVLLRPTRDSGPIFELAPHIRNYQSLQGKATAYVCRNFSCQSPVTDAESLLELLKD